MVGLDGVPFSLLSRLAEEGVMRRAAEMVRMGRLQRMRVSIPEISPVSWTSFATGANPGRHGIFGYVDFKPGSYALRFPTFADCAARTIWDRVGAAGGRSVVLNQPFTYPALRLAGWLVSGFVAPERERAVYPRSLLRELERLGYRFDIDAGRCRVDHDLLFRELTETLESRRRALEHLWPRDWSYFQVVVSGTDRLQHFLWDAVVDPGHPRHPECLAYYRDVDRFVGEVWDRFCELEGEGAGERFLLLSDHGFTAVRREVNLNAWLRQEGYLRVGAGENASLSEADERSVAFCLDPGRLYLNRRGRFPRGNLGEREAETVAQEMKEKLLGLELGGEAVMRAVFAGVEIYRGPQAERAPDLVALANYGFDLKGSLREEEVFTLGELTGMHTWDDAFALSGGELPRPLFIWDLSRLILSRMGIEQIAESAPRGGGGSRANTK